MNMTLAQKQALEALVQSGKAVISLAYDPNTVSNDPETEVLAAGWTQFLREVENNLIEVVYTR